jgi:transcriptional regulator of acetoin/glycerol metabolism
MKNVLQAWEAFHSGHKISSSVRPTVLESWQRSRQHAIAVTRPAARTLTEAEFHRRHREHGHFLQAARSAMDEARQFLKGTNSMAILADQTGAVLETEGDARAIDFGHAVNLARRGVWNEAEIGTNAIGTALAIAKPVQIHAAEHFCSEIQKWTCAAAPVRHPADESIIGVVDISGPAATFNPQSLAHAVAMAHQIEALIGRRIEAEHEAVLRHFLGKRSLWLTEEIIAFGRNGTIIHASERALREIARRNPDILTDGRLTLFRGISTSLWSRRLAAELPKASVEVVSQNGEDLGGILVIHRTHRPQPRATMRDEETESLPFEAILGDSPAIRQAREKARRMAESGSPVLLEGETGVGKELFARAIHGARSPAGPFVPVNCGGLPRDLIASEIFGYEKGAFTGADDAGRSGKVEAADGGVLCLDEIGEMPLDLQSYLLRVLEDGHVYRIGTHKPRRVGIRLVSMTNRDLSDEVAKGLFRKDLYYRISALRLRIPPLRERGDDPILLMERLCRKSAERTSRAAPLFTATALDLLRNYRWPGNVRELRNVADMMTTMCGGETVDAPRLVREMKNAGMWKDNHAADDLKSLEQAAIMAAIEACDGNLSRAAKRLGIARSTLYARLNTFLRQSRSE